MDFNEIIQVVFRWLHVVAGILWIGLLYFYNFVNTPFAGTMDGDTKKKVIPELQPRALFWFRWGAFWTWISGVILLIFVFYTGSLMFEGGTDGWNGMSYLMIALVFLAPFIYDIVMKPIKDNRVVAVVGILLVVLMMYLMTSMAGFSYRAYVIHIGSMLGTIMAFNVWFRIWPSQQKIVMGIKTGSPADASLVSLAGTRSKHNTYMSVPLVWAMINAHTATVAAGSWIYFLVVILIGWSVVFWMYKKAGTIKGF